MGQKYRNPMSAIGSIIQTSDFMDFKKNKKRVSDNMHIINNFPEHTYKALFNDYSNVSKEFFKIEITNYNNSIETHHYPILFRDKIREQLDNNDVRYIFVWISLKMTGHIGHINCVIIDKQNKYALIFEPKVKIDYDLCLITDILDLNNDYQILVPTDIGFHYFNRLQRFNHFCQTYVLFVFMIIIENDIVEYNKFSKMMSDIINNQSLGHFLYYTHMLIHTDIKISHNHGIFWEYPDGCMQGIFNRFKNWINLCMNTNYQNHVLEMDELVIDDKDMVIWLED